MSDETTNIPGSALPTGVALEARKGEAVVAGYGAPPLAPSPPLPDAMPDPLLGVTVGARYGVQRRLLDSPVGPVYEAWDGASQRFVWLQWFDEPLSDDLAERVRSWGADRQREYQNGLLPRFAAPVLGLCEDSGRLSGVLFAPVAGERVRDRIRVVSETVRLVRHLAYQVAQRSSGLSLQSMDERTVFVADGAFVLLGYGLYEMFSERHVSCRAPEVSAHSQWVGPAADVYSLASLALGLLPSPTSATAPKPTWQIHTEDAVRDVLARSASKDPSTRASSLADLDRQLGEALAPKAAPAAKFGGPAVSTNKEWSPLAIAGVIIGIPLFLCLVGGGLCLIFGQVANP